MFTAKVYKICIASASGAMKEERIAQDVVSRWNCQHGEEKGVVFLSVPQETASDIYVFLIDNFVDTAKIEAAIATTETRVVLFFTSFHDVNNTMASELKAVADFREKVQTRCTCLDFKDCREFELLLPEVLNQVEKD